jgi:putative aldouronate transport system substrate-binding protein
LTDQIFAFIIILGTLTNVHNAGVGLRKFFQEELIMKRNIILTSVLLAMAVSLFAAGGGQSAATSGGKPQISISILDRGVVPAGEGTYEDNRWTRWVNENSPVAVRWVPITRYEAYDRTNALIAAGTAPDLFFEYGKGWMDYYYHQEVIQPVGDYINQYSVEYKAYLQKHPELLPYMTAEDGKIYGLTSARIMPGVLNHGAVIRQDWLDKFRIKAPTTVAELLEFCRRVRDEDPDGNGVKDTYGIGFANAGMVIFRTMFGCEVQSGSFVQNGHLVDWTSTPGYREMLTFLAQAYKEGYIDPEYVTDAPQYARGKQLFLTGKTGTYFQSYFPGETDWRELKQNVPSSQLAVFEPITTGTGRYGFLTEPPANHEAVMNKDSKNGQDIMKFVDWIISKGWFDLSYGTEGRHYRLVNGIPQTIDVELNKIERIYCGDYPFLSGAADVWEASWIPIAASQDALSQDYAKAQMAAIEQTAKNPYRRDIPYTPTSENISRFSNETAAQITAIETNIILGNVTVDAGLRQINDYKNSFGWAAIQQEKDAWYQKNKSNF